MGINHSVQLFPGNMLIAACLGRHYMWSVPYGTDKGSLVCLIKYNLYLFNAYIINYVCAVNGFNILST